VRQDNSRWEYQRLLAAVLTTAAKIQTTAAAAFGAPRTRFRCPLPVVLTVAASLHITPAVHASNG
jgi:hypothetical protein